MKKLMSIAALACVLTILNVSPGSAAAVLRLGWTTTGSELDPYAIGARLFKAEVEKLTNNEVVIELYPNRQLGDEKQMLEGLRFGTVDMAIITNSVVAQLEPSYGLLDLPFVFADERAVHTALDSEPLKVLSQKLASKGIVQLAYFDAGFRHMFNNKRPVRELKDVQGVKFRVLQSPIFIEMFTLLGGAAIPMAWGETYTALQQGTIDGLEAAPPVLLTGKFHETGKYLSLSNHIFAVITLLGSNRSLQKLTAPQREAIATAARNVVGDQRRANTANIQLAVDEMKKSGLQVNEIADLAPFRNAMGPIYQKARAVVGEELMDYVLKPSK